MMESDSCRTPSSTLASSPSVAQETSAGTGVSDKTKPEAPVENVRRIITVDDESDDDDPLLTLPASSSVSREMNGGTVESDAIQPETSVEIVPIIPVNDDDDPLGGWDPMAMDYYNDIGFIEGDHFQAQRELRFKEGRLKDVPCKFHDGYSGTCWKGLNCPYGHEKYTGVKFAQKNDLIAYAATQARDVAPLFWLPPKALLNKDREMCGKITHVVSPGEFYFKPTREDAACSCQKLDELIKTMKVVDEEKKKEDQMDGYYHGFTAFEMQDGFANPNDIKMKKAHFIPLDTLETRMTALLTRTYTYKKRQCEQYMPMELLAVRIQRKWYRAVHLYSGEREQINGLVRVQLLDTGRKLILMDRDVTRLPERFTFQPAAAFKGSLFRVSPVWKIWSTKVANFFKSLVEGKEIRAIVKDGMDCQSGETSGLEAIPYDFKLMIKDDKDDAKWKDVAQILIDEGMALEWNLLPFRPFARKVMDTTGFDFVYNPNPPRLSEKDLETERKRFERYLNLKAEEGKDSGDSTESWRAKSWSSQSLSSFTSNYTRKTDLIDKFDLDGPIHEEK